MENKTSKRKLPILLLSIAGAIVFLAIAAVIAFFVVKGAGEKSLRQSAVVASFAEGEKKEEATASYQGKKYRYRDNIINILCLGIDKEEEMWERDDDGGSIGQADAIFVVSLDFEKDEINLIAVPRDTMVTLQLYDGNGYYRGEGPGQITLQYAYGDGQELSRTLMTQQIADLFQVPIHGCLAINLSMVSPLNDAVGGVDITMDDDYTFIRPEFEMGETLHLEGEMALDYVQGRDVEVDGSAYSRISRQKQYLTAFFEQFKVSAKQDFRVPIKMLQTMPQYVETDINIQEMTYLAAEGITCSFGEENMHVLEGEIVQGEVHEEYQLNDDALTALIMELFYEEVPEDTK